MNRGRPKNEIPRSERLGLRLTKFEAEKISKIAAKKNITKTEAILQGMDLLIAHKPKKFKNLNEKSAKNSSANLAEEVIMWNKK